MLDPLIERRAGMSMDLLASWEEIVGPAHAPHSRPEKLDWGKSAKQAGTMEPAVLVVACAGPRAIYLQHDADTVLARVNAYFGFRAVSKLRVVQKPLTKSRALRPPRAAAKPLGNAPKKVTERLDRIDDPALRDVLSRLGKGVFSGGSRGSR